MVKANSLGLIACTAADAVVTGSIQYEDRFKNLGWWRDTASTASWDIVVPADGNYQVSVDYACNETCGGDFEVTIVDVDNGGSSQITQNLPPRKDWGDFKTVQVGVLPLKAGHQAVTVKAASKPGESFINLRNVTLRPVE